MSITLAKNAEQNRLGDKLAAIRQLPREETKAPEKSRGLFASPSPGTLRADRSDFSKQGKEPPKVAQNPSAPFALTANATASEGGGVSDGTPFSKAAKSK